MQSAASKRVFTASALALLVLVAVGLAALAWWRDSRANADLSQKLQALVPWPTVPGQPCPWLRQSAADSEANRPLVLLVFGQSNAGNHGAEMIQAGTADPGRTVTVTDGSYCWRVGDPLPGATGRSQSIWSRLEAALAAEGVRRDVIVMLLAVDSTSVAQWADTAGPLGAALADRLKRAAGMPVDLVLWQQGESDARAGTSEDAYGAAWASWLRVLRDAGVKAPVMPALSTRCRNPSGEPVRASLAALPQRWPGVVAGPDTDLLSGAMRERDCHFSPQGLDQAAKSWARAIKRHLVGS